VTPPCDVDGSSASTSPLPLAGEGTVREARPLAPNKDFTGGSGRSGLRARSAGFLIRRPQHGERPRQLLTGHRHQGVGPDRGGFSDGNGHVQGCLLSGGQYTTFDDPSAVSTFAFGIRYLAGSTRNGLTTPISRL
jgi:hypothetical protein